MAAANPGRTSWTADEVRGKLVPKWAKTVKPYISKKVQLVIGNSGRTALDGA